eukprot:scaffold141308_cov53-Attheya_sp.AAC.1
MTLSSDEFRDGLAIRYGYELLNLPEKCDGCGAKFSVGHALVQCKTGGLVNMRHNMVKDELSYLSDIATSSNAVQQEEQQQQQQQIQMQTLNLLISKKLLKDFMETCIFEVSDGMLATEAKELNKRLTVLPLFMPQTYAYGDHAFLSSISALDGPIGMMELA